MSEQSIAATHTVTVITITEAGRTYSLEEAARISGVHPDLLRHYCQIGLLGRDFAGQESARRFDDNALYWLRRIEQTRRRHGLDRAVLPLVCELWHEIERLEAEVRALRGS